jgi:hypothetical protein
MYMDQLMRSIRRIFFRDLASFCSKNKDHFIVGGDFNIMRFVSDKNKSFIPNRLFGFLNTIINDNDLREIHIIDVFCTNK